MIEVWQEIKDFNGHYHISSHGNVRSINYEDRFNLKFMTDSHGYKYVIIYLNNEPHKQYIHNLVGRHFIKDDAYYYHLDGNKDNNKFNNLDIIIYKPVQHRKANNSHFEGVRCYYNNKVDIRLYECMIKFYKNTIIVSGFENEVDAYRIYRLGMKNIHLYKGNDKEFIKILKDKANIL
jgi:hypothetical protein